MSLGEAEELQEMMVIEIAFGSGSQQVEDVLVHWGDNPQDLAEVCRDFLEIIFVHIKAFTFILLICRSLSASTIFVRT